MKDNTNVEMIKELEEKIEELKKEVDKMDKYKGYKDAADEFALLFKAFKDAGFSRAETIELMKMGMESNRPRLF